MKHKKAFTLVEIMIVLAIVGLIVSIAVPAFLKNRHDAQGLAANKTLLAIHAAKQQIAFKLNAKPGDIINVTNAQLEAYMRGVKIDDGSQDGGKYIVGPLIDASGEVIIPVCTSEKLVWQGGPPNGEEGLFICTPGFIQDPTTGFYHRDLTYTFADQIASAT